MAKILLLLLIWALADECSAGCALACLLKSGERSSAWLLRLLPGFLHPCLRRAEQGHTAQPTPPMAPLPLPLRGWGPMSPMSALLTLTPGKLFLECRKISQPTLPNTWELKPHMALTGMVVSLPQGLMCSCSNKEKKFQQPEVSVFRFALPLVVPVAPGSCWCKTFPRQMPLVLEMAGNSFFFRLWISKITNQQTKTLPKGISARLKEETVP